MIEWLLSSLGEWLFFLSYVSGRETFPPPLSPQEERQALAELAQGSRQARSTLIERNLRLVAHVAKKYHGCGIEQEDLISIGAIGLIKAVNTYRQDQGVQLATYAARCVENEIRMAIRSRRKSRGEVSLSEPVGVDKEGNEIALCDILGTDPELVEAQVEQRVSLRRAKEVIRDRLTEKERLVVEQRYGLAGNPPLPQREVARRLGISRSYVSRIEKRAVEKLKAEFGRGAGPCAAAADKN